MTIGASGATGQLALAGSGSGVVTILPQFAAGTYNFNLPTGAGTSGQPLLSGGGGAAPMTFGSLAINQLAAISADNLIGNPTGSSAAPAGVPLLNCSGGGNALNYSTSTHVFSCNTISGSGTVQSGTAGQLTWYPSSTNVVGGNSNANISNGTLTLGTANATLGALILEGSSSGAVTLTPQTTAGTPTITYGTSSGTPAVTATAPLSITTATGNISITGAAGQVLAGAAPAFTPTPTLGISSKTGALNLDGLTSGRVTVTVADVAGTWTGKLPTTAGSGGQFLETDGGSPANLTWATVSGTGTVNSAAAGLLAYYPGPTSTNVVAGNANASISGGNLTLGQANTTAGGILLNGQTSGTITISAQSAAGTFNFNLPITAGTAGQALLSGGGGASPMTWGTVNTPPPTPQGRLTLASGTPVMTTTQSAKTTIYYDCTRGGPGGGQLVPVYSGSVSVAFTITSCEISMGLDAGVPHIASGSSYDIFAINNSGSLAICAGPAWTSTTTRGTGATTTEIDWTTTGYGTNKNSLTHCWGGASGVTDYGSISANQATLLGTVNASANGTTQCVFATSGSGWGTAGSCLLANAYNQVQMTMQLGDTVSSYSYGTTTIREAHGSTTANVAYIDPVGTMTVGARYLFGCNCVSGMSNGIGIDSTTVFSGNRPLIVGSGNDMVGTAEYSGVVGLGLHTLAALEVAYGATNTVFGNVEGAGRDQTGLVVGFWQ